jgi:hypothetical protein
MIKRLKHWWNRETVRDENSRIKHLTQYCSCPSCIRLRHRPGVTTDKKQEIEQEMR